MDLYEFNTLLQVLWQQSGPMYGVSPRAIVIDANHTSCTIGHGDRVAGQVSLGAMSWITQAAVAWGAPMQVPYLAGLVGCEHWNILAKAV